MNSEEAYTLLGVSIDDDLQTVRAKFRRLMGRYHPDAVGSDHPVHTARAQKLNEAYQLVKKHLSARSMQTEKIFWQVEENNFAFAGRNIYMPYHMDLSDLDAGERLQAEGMLQTVAHGKYYWDPDEEEFVCFFKSIHHLAIRLLKTVEEQEMIEEDPEQLRLSFELQLLPLLTGQFVQPVICLRKLFLPDHIDERGRETYLIPAWLGTKGTCAYDKVLAGLQEGAPLYPQRMQHNRLYVTDLRDRALGALSFEDDALYVVLIPLMQGKKVQVKMSVQTVTVKKRPASVRVAVQLYLRLRENAVDEQEDGREEIKKILDTYRQELGTCS